MILVILFTKYSNLRRTTRIQVYNLKSLIIIIILTKIEPIDGTLTGTATQGQS